MFSVIVASHGDIEMGLLFVAFVHSAYYRRRVDCIRDMENLEADVVS
jgi:hypothetical protein